MSREIVSRLPVYVYLFFLYGKETEKRKFFASESKSHTGSVNYPRKRAYGAQVYDVVVHFAGRGPQNAPQHHTPAKRMK